MNSPSCVTRIGAALLARQKAEADLRDLYRERALDGAEAAGTCAAPAAFLYVCGVKKRTQLVTQRADGPLPGLSLSSGYISPARAAFGGKAVTAPSATSPRLMTVPLG